MTANVPLTTNELPAYIREQAEQFHDLLNFVAGIMLKGDNDAGCEDAFNRAGHAQIRLEDLAIQLERLIGARPEWEARPEAQDGRDTDKTFYYVTIPTVEFLPGQRFCDPPVSRELYSRDLAKLSLEHVQKSVPDAKLMRFTSLDLAPDELRHHHRMMEFDELRAREIMEEQRQRRAGAAQ